MVDMNIVKMAVDAYRGRLVTDKFSVAQSQDSLRQALIDANGGSTKVDYRAIRDGKCGELFSLVETILAVAINEGFVGDEYFMNLVDYHNVALGDAPTFVVEDGTTFIVADVAEGTQGIRRQRITGEYEVTVPTQLKAVRIYEELNRILAGHVDFNKLIDKVALSFRRAIVDDIYAVWTGATTNTYDLSGNAVSMDTATFTNTATGSYSEAVLLDLIAKVEATTGKAATVMGTKAGLRNLAPSVQSIDSANDLYNLGLEIA